MKSKKHIKKIKKHIKKNKKTYKKVKRMKQIKKYKPFFYIRGGMFDKLIGEGTHGKIYTLKNNHTQVVKIYANRILFKNKKVYV